MYDDDVRPTPPVVVGAVAAGTTPLPFLAVYTVMFLVHGSFHPVNPPDVTSTKGGEFVAGWIALALFIVTTVSLLQFLNGRRRWPFAIVQLGVLITAVDFVLDRTKGGTSISLLLVVTSLLALILGFAPASWQHVRFRRPGYVDSAYGWWPGASRRAAERPAADPALARSAQPSSVEPASLRRRGASRLRRRSKADA